MEARCVRAMVARVRVRQACSMAGRRIGITFRCEVIVFPSGLPCRRLRDEAGADDAAATAAADGRILGGRRASMASAVTRGA